MVLAGSQFPLRQKACLNHQGQIRKLPGSTTCIHKNSKMMVSEKRLRVTLELLNGVVEGTMGALAAIPGAKGAQYFRLSAVEMGRHIMQ